MSDLRVAVADCRPDPRQPRQYFRQSALQALANSIASVGQRTPIEVRKLPAGSGAKFEIIDGERRWRACQLIGQKTIRVCVEAADLTHQHQHFLSVISNFHREGHTHMEISNALQYQVDCAEGEQGVVARIAESLGKSEGWVYQYLQLQRLAPKLQAKMHPDTDAKQLLRFNEAVVLASLPTEEQAGVYAQMIKQPVHGRLAFARQLVSKITGKERTGRPVEVKRHIDRFTARLQADMDRVMDLKQSEFLRAIAQVPAAELQVFRKSLQSTVEHLKLLMDATDRAVKSR